MTIKNHLTPRYIVNRIRESIYRKLHPDSPWLTPHAIRYLDSWLSRSSDGVELGSGRSTVWIANRSRHLISVESHRGWYQKVKTMLNEADIRNVEYIFAPVIDGEQVSSAPYLMPLRAVQDESKDFILVDGDYRDSAALLAIRKIKSGGIVIVDNCNWFMPSNSKSPSSVPLNGSCRTSEWERFVNDTADWEKHWTSNGVTDTCIYFKP